MLLRAACCCARHAAARCMRLHAACGCALLHAAARCGPRAASFAASRTPLRFPRRALPRAAPRAARRRGPPSWPATRLPRGTAARTPASPNRQQSPKVTADRAFNGYGTNYENSAEPIYGTQASFDRV
jgi:hypothetical protein